LRLIKFTTLYSKRNVPCEVATPAPELEKLRRKHRRRAEDFYDSSSDSSFSESLFEQRMSKSARRPAPKPRHDEEAVSLADLVPMFVGLSAARATLFEDDKVSAHEGWMDLAGEFMLQAALEQCLEYSDCSGAKLREIFSWGWKANPKQSWEDEQVVNEMFCDDEEMKENESWARIRSKYIDLVSSPLAAVKFSLTQPQLKPKSNTDLAKQLRALTRRYPIDNFEERILRFMEAVQLSLELPILAQLDTGKIDGMTQRQVQELKKRITLPCS
jgi:hypothetical protein